MYVISILSAELYSLTRLLEAVTHTARHRFLKVPAEESME
jgi:hypothetical protein